MENEKTIQKKNKKLGGESSSYMSLKHMKSLIVLVVGLLSVGCGQSDIERLEEEKLTQEYETEFQMSEDENKRLEAEIESNKLKTEIEAKSKKKQDELLRRHEPKNGILQRD